jgi:hypothetical protein
MSSQTQTHILPLAVMAILVICGGAALIQNFRRRRQLQATVEEQFKEFRTKAVGLMDQLDALRQRHKTLPSTDPDFTAPIAGATLALYNGVEADLNALWDRWLKVMELWDQAQKLVRSGSGLAVKQAEEARKLLEKGDIDDLLRQSRSCKSRLDRLNQGHGGPDWCARNHDALASVTVRIEATPRPCLRETSSAPCRLLTARRSSDRRRSFPERRVQAAIDERPGAVRAVLALGVGVFSADWALRPADAPHYCPGGVWADHRRFLGDLANGHILVLVRRLASTSLDKAAHTSKSPRSWLQSRNLLHCLDHFHHQYIATGHVLIRLVHSGEGLYHVFISKFHIII